MAAWSSLVRAWTRFSSSRLASAVACSMACCEARAFLAWASATAWALMRKLRSVLIRSASVKDRSTTRDKMPICDALSTQKFAGNQPNLLAVKTLTPTNTAVQERQ